MPRAVTRSDASAITAVLPAPIAPVMRRSLRTASRGGGGRHAPRRRLLERKRQLDEPRLAARQAGERGAVRPRPRIEARRKRIRGRWRRRDEPERNDDLGEAGTRRQI